MPSEDEVVVKKRALLRLKQQVSAVLRGEDLPEGAQACELAEVPYQVPSVAQDATQCPVCQKSYPNHHKLMKHMGVHRGEKFPCDRCGKMLASRRMLRFHQSACTRGKQVECPVCKKPYGSRQGMRQHFKVTHGTGQPEVDETFTCPYCSKAFNVKKSMREHSFTCAANPNKRGPFFCRVAGCAKSEHPFVRIKNLNQHMALVHGWAERKT